MVHVEQIPAGSGDASAQYTWTCDCGHCRMKWPGRGAAMMSKQYHFQRAHGLPLIEEFLASELDRQANYSHLRGRLSAG